MQSHIAEGEEYNWAYRPIYKRFRSIEACHLTQFREWCKTRIPTVWNSEPMEPDKHEQPIRRTAVKPAAMPSQRTAAKPAAMPSRRMTPAEPAAITKALTPAKKRRLRKKRSKMTKVARPKLVAVPKATDPRARILQQCTPHMLALNSQRERCLARQHLQPKQVGVAKPRFQDLLDNWNRTNEKKLRQRGLIRTKEPWPVNNNPRFDKNEYVRRYPVAYFRQQKDVEQDKKNKIKDTPLGHTYSPMMYNEIYKTQRKDIVLK